MAWAKQHAAPTQTNTRKVAPLTNASSLGMTLSSLLVVLLVFGLIALGLYTFRAQTGTSARGAGKARQNFDLAPPGFAPSEPHVLRGAFELTAEDGRAYRRFV